MSYGRVILCLFLAGCAPTAKLGHPVTLNDKQYTPLVTQTHNMVGSNIMILSLIESPDNKVIVSAPAVSPGLIKSILPSGQVKTVPTP